MSNLLDETLGHLTRAGLTEKDVLWVGTQNGEKSISWKSFAKLANIDYDSGYGGEEIRLDLVVVGKNWWLERHEYDGSEWWEFKKLPIEVINPKRMYTVWNEYHDEPGHAAEEQNEPIKDIWEEWKEDQQDVKLIEQKKEE